MNTERHPDPLGQDEYAEKAAQDPAPPAYAWHITVRRWGPYGDRIVTETPTVVIAANRTQVTEKVRAMFEATYDSFRKFWSHDWTLREVHEVTS